MLDNILTKVELTELIEELVRKEKLSYIEAIIHICEERSIDPLDIGKLVDKTMKSRVEAEARELNMLPGKTNSLKEFMS